MTLTMTTCGENTLLELTTRDCDGGDYRLVDAWRLPTSRCNETWVDDCIHHCAARSGGTLDVRDWRGNGDQK